MMTPKELFASYEQLKQFYNKARNCNIGREAEHLSELVLHLLHEDKRHIEMIFDNESQNSIHQRFKRRLNETDAGANINLSPSLDQMKSELINIWRWNWLKCLFIQGRYGAVFDEIEKLCGEQFFIWSVDDERNVSFERFYLRDSQRLILYTEKEKS